MSLEEEIEGQKYLVDYSHMDLQTYELPKEN